MSNPAKLSLWRTFRSARLHFSKTKYYDGYSRNFWPALRRTLALLMALLLPLWQVDVLAQQQANPPQFGQPGQDYSGQIQSDDPNYPAQQAYPAGGAYPQQAYPAGEAYPQQAYPPQVSQPAIQPLSPDRLQQLVAPIALYPDSLVGLVLTASTYPAQVQQADAWLQAQGNAPPEQIAAGANVQNWDPSIKALTAFPQVVALMDQNLPWTTDLGTAYFNQPSDVLEAVQVMRARAQSAGNLQPNLQEAVNYVGGNIQIAPPNPQVVYVPAYNPWVVYGQPVSPYPGFSLSATLGSIGSWVGSAFIHWGPGIAMTAFTSMPWGLVAWGVSWLVQAILFHNSNYYSNSTMVADWGFPHGGPRAWQAYGGGSGYGGGSNGYARIQRGYGYAHQPSGSYNYARGGYTTGPGNVLVHRPPSVAQTSVPHPSNGYGRPGGGYANAYGHGLANPSNGYGGYRTAQAPGSGFGYPRGVQQSRVTANVPRPSLNDRALPARAPSGAYSQRSTSAFGNRGYSSPYQTQARSSGFHPFGSSHGSESFHAPRSESFHGPKAESFHAPKMKAPKSSGGGGHSGGHSSGGKHHH
jgi:Protein of unknown function (DUF3300)